MLILLLSSKLRAGFSCPSGPSAVICEQARLETNALRILHGARAIGWPALWAAEGAALGVTWPRGLLLHGPPGTGKTAAVQVMAALTYFRLNHHLLRCYKPSRLIRSIKHKIQKTMRIAGIWAFRIFAVSGGCPMRQHSEQSAAASGGCSRVRSRSPHHNSRLSAGICYG